MEQKPKVFADGFSFKRQEKIGRHTSEREFGLL